MYVHLSSRSSDKLASRPSSCEFIESPCALVEPSCFLPRELNGFVDIQGPGGNVRRIEDVNGGQRRVDLRHAGGRARNRARENVARPWNSAREDVVGAQRRMHAVQIADVFGLDLLVGF